MRPRLAAAIIAGLWFVAIVAFGILERLVDPGSFKSIWQGMWWATQTVTTVGYGDIVPGQTSGRLIASVLMIGGLSLFAVVTGVITSSFVERSRAARQEREGDPLLAKMDEMEATLAEIRADVARLSPGGGATDR